MFRVDVTKVDLDVAYIFYRIAGILSEVASLMIDLNVPCNIKLMLRRVFLLIINGWLTTNFNIF